MTLGNVNGVVVESHCYNREMFEHNSAFTVEPDTIMIELTIVLRCRLVEVACILVYVIDK